MDRVVSTHLAFPPILWNVCHHRHKAERVISLVAGVAHQHLVVVARLPTVSDATITMMNWEYPSKMLKITEQKPPPSHLS